MANTCILYERSAFEIRHPDATGFLSWEWVVAEQARCSDVMHDAKLPLVWTSEQARAALMFCLTVRQLGLWAAQEWPLRGWR